MQAICLGGPCHGLEAELPHHQDVFRPVAGLRPLYIRLYQSADRAYAYFAFSDLSRLEANQLVMEHIRGRGRGPGKVAALALTGSEDRL